MSRSSAERSRYKKYDYKTHHTSFTQRTETNQLYDSARKTSAFKIRKDSTENSLPTNYAEDIRLPLGEIFENSAKVARALADPRKDRSSLRTRNEELEQQLEKQNKEVEQLRNALSSLHGLLGAQRDGQQLKEANASLQARCEAQDREMSILKQEVQALKTLVEQGAIDSYNSNQL